MSGYSLEHLLPENGRDLAKALVGSEGTLGVILDATVDLVPISPARPLVVLGYPDMAPPPTRCRPCCSMLPLASKVWMRGWSTWSGGPRGAVRCRTCPAARAG